MLLRLRLDLRRLVRFCLCGRVLFQLHGDLRTELFFGLFRVFFVLHELLFTRLRQRLLCRLRQKLLFQRWRLVLLRLFQRLQWMQQLLRRRVLRFVQRMVLFLLRVRHRLRIGVLQRLLQRVRREMLRWLRRFMLRMLRVQRHLQRKLLQRVQKQLQRRMLWRVL